MTNTSPLLGRAVIQCVGALATDHALAAEWAAKAGRYVDPKGNLTPNLDEARVFGPLDGLRYGHNARYRRLPVTLAVTP